MGTASPIIAGTSAGTTLEGSGAVISAQLTDASNNGSANTWSISNPGTYGAASINPTTGMWSYDVNDTNAAVKALDPGQTLTDIFQVQLTDGGGTVTQNITITIQGNFCFAAGTRIRTADGLRAIETIKAGDLVETLDHGLQPVRWVGRQAHSAQVLQLAPKLRGIIIGKGALGHGPPSADVCLSRHHRVMLRSDLARRLFGQEEVLIAAHRLIGLQGVASRDYAGGIDYCHLLFDRHELLLVEGLASETLFLGSQNEIDFADKAMACAGTLPTDMLARCAKLPARPIPSPDIQRKIVADVLRAHARAAA